jgi:uncharacterized membrane protein
MNWLKDTFRLSLTLLVIIYLVGIVTVLLGFPEQLMKLTPYNLIFVTFLFLYNAAAVNSRYVIWFLIIGISGYLVELAGILTGLIFGNYLYGEGLGIRLAGVPLMIGVNWALLVFATASLVNRMKLAVWLKAAFAASLMVIYDILLEPVAMRFDFWSWAGDQVPVQNYIAWWIIAFVMHLGVLTYVKKPQNRLALPVILIQAVFFLVLILSENLSVF